MPTMEEFERRLADLVDSLGFGPMTQATRAGRPNPELRSRTMPPGERMRAETADALRPYLGPRMAERLGQAAGGVATVGEAMPDSMSVVRNILMQPVVAGEALGEAAADPTLANVTNAGVQTALTFGRPLAAAGALGAGYFEALRRDLGAGPVSSAEAAPQKGKREQRVYEGLNADQSARLDELRAKVEARSASRAERQEFEQLNAIVSDLQRKRNTAGAEEYERAVQRAEAARDSHLRRAENRFSNTPMGEIYRKTGGTAPFLAAAGLGALHGLSKGTKTATNAFLWPAIEGTGGAFMANNVPSLYNAFMVDADNPEKAAYLAYARELPPGHPRKQEFADYAERLPDINPVVSAARREFEVPALAERLFASALEGVPSGVSGANLGGMVRAGGEGVRNAFARGGGSPPALPPPPPAAPQRNLMKIRDRNGVVRYWDEDAKRWVKRSDVE